MCNLLPRQHQCREQIKTILHVALVTGYIGCFFQQSNPIAVGYALGAVRILSHVIQTGSDGLSAALEQLGDQTRPHPFPTDYLVSLDIERGRSAQDKPHVKAVREFGSCCGKDVKAGK